MPTSVELAVDIGNYADKAAVFYAPLSATIDALIIDPNDAGARALFEAILADLVADAEGYEAAAAQVESDLHDFATRLSADKGTLESLSAEYAISHGASGDELDQFRAQKDELQTLVNQLRDDYHHSVVVAGTTPTYAFIAPPIGLICAATVAGIYGSQARALMDQIHATDDQIAALGVEIARAERLRNSLDHATNSLAEIEEAVGQALPAIGIIRGHWQLMHGDLEAIVELVRDDLPASIPLLQQLQVNLALSEWASVGTQAEGYVRNAYISVVEE